MSDECAVVRDASCSCSAISFVEGPVEGDGDADRPRRDGEADRRRDSRDASSDASESLYSAVESVEGRTDSARRPLRFVVDRFAIRSL